jgi:hypothetical protein
MENLERLYTVPIGAGGYGVVMGSSYNKKYAVKFLHREECASARREFNTNRAVYAAAKTCSFSKVIPYIGVVKPVNFFDADSSNYSCSITMERLYFEGPNGETVAIHAILNGVVDPSQYGKIILTPKGIPRGVFYGPREVATLVEKYSLGSLRNVTFRIGFLEAICIFGAKMIPVDAEYLLNVKHNELLVTMVDFGMFEDMNVTDENYERIANEIYNAQDSNIYYSPMSDAIPGEEGRQCKEAFLIGFQTGYGCFSGNPVYEKLYKKLLSLY